MADIIVNESAVTTIVEVADGNVVVTTSGQTDVVSTESASTITATSTAVDVVTLDSGETVIVDQDQVTVIVDESTPLTVAQAIELTHGDVTALHKHDFDNITFPTQWSLGEFTHTYTLQELMNHEWSAGVVHGCDLTNNGDGTISTASGMAVIRGVADSHTTLYGVVVSAQANIVLTDDATNYIYLDYNAGAPQFAVSTAITSFNCMDKCIAWVVHRDGNSLHYIDAREQNVDSNRKMRQLFLKYARFIHAEGGTTLGSNGLAITLTAGSFYFMLAEQTHSAFDTSIGGTANANVFTLWTVAAGVWTDTPNSKVVSTTTYNNTTTGVQTLGNNKFGITWFYIINNSPSELHAVMGQAQYANISDARVASPPVTIPSIVSGVGVLVGFVVYEKSNTVFNNVYSSFATSFTPGLATTHNGLSGLQGGIANEYYHMTAAQYAALGSSSGSGAIGVPGSDGEDGESAFIVLNSPASSAGTGMSHQEVLSRISFRM